MTGSCISDEKVNARVPKLPSVAWRLPKSTNHRTLWQIVTN